MTRQFPKPLVAFALIFALAAPASAQFDVQSVGNWQLNSNITHVQGLILKDQLYTGKGRQPSRLVAPSARTAAEAGKPAVPVASLRSQLAFSPTMEVRRRTLSGIFGKLSLTDPEAVRQRKEFIARPATLFGPVEAGLRPLGLSAANLADAQAVWMINAWSAVNGQFAPTTAQTAQAVRDQITRSMAGVPAILAMSDAQKQAMSDELIVFAVMYSSGAQSFAKGSPEMAAFQRDLRRSVAQSGFDVDRVRLTSNGFVAVR